MKTRKLTGMTVTEIKAPTQDKLFEKLAKFAKSGRRGRSIDSVNLTTDFDAGVETAVVVWA